MFGLEGFLGWKSEICKTFKSKIIFYDSYFNKNKANYKVNSLFTSITDFKNKFIISSADKASNNFCIMCKVFYKKFLMDECLGHSTYTKITYPYSEIKKRLNAFAKKLKLHISCLTFPYLFVTTKFYKNPVKFRFITCAINSYSCHAGKVFFNL